MFYLVLGCLLLVAMVVCYKAPFWVQVVLLVAGIAACLVTVLEG